jgi:O-methyltransferase involved in polyketide biosynthesis
MNGESADSGGGITGVIASPQSVTGVERPLFGMADLRARDSGRPDRLFDDSCAHAFVEAGRALHPY